MTERKATTPSLYNISEDLLTLGDLLAEVGGDVTDEQAEEAITKWFEEIGEARDAKLDNYAALYRTLDARAEMRKAEAARLTDLAAVDGNTAERLKKRLKVFFELHELTTVQTDHFRLSLVNNGGAAPIEVDDNVKEHPEQLPEEYRKVSFSVNMLAVREKLQIIAAKQAAGQELTADDQLPWARLGERGQHLRIK